MRERGRELTIVAALAMLSGYLSLTQANFRDAFTISTILTNAAYVAVVGIGMTIVIVAGQIDISVGSMLAVCALITGTLARAGVPMPLVVLAGLLLGLGMGALNGALVAYLRVPSIIVTLATLTVLRGAIVWWTKGYWVMPLPPGWKVLGTTHLLGLPLPVWIGWAAVLAASILLAHTVFGLKIYAAGSHPQAAQLNGIDTARVTFWVFALNGLLVGLATMLHVTRFSMVQTQEGLGLEFLVITAVVVGGTNIFGGSGTVVGTYLGVLLLTVTSSALTFLGISATWDQAISGAFNLVAESAAIGVATGTLAGWLNGWVIARIRVPAIVVTLATLAVYRGIATGLSGGTGILGFPESFLTLGAGTVVGIPVQTVIWIAGIVIAAVFLTRTTNGRYIYGIGHNETALRFSGIAVDRIVLGLYTASGFVAALAGMIYAARVGTAKSNAAAGYELSIITAVVLGGTSLAGGEGTLVGTVLGVLILTILQNGLTLARVPAAMQDVLIGTVLLAAVWTYRERPMRKEVSAQSTSQPAPRRAAGRAMSDPENTLAAGEERRKP